MPSSNTAIQLSYQVCPIVLQGGVSAQVPGGMMPILNVFGAQVGAGGGGGNVNALGLPFDLTDLDDAFGAFNVLPGGTLVNQQIAKYPFANQSVAANATIREPLTISVIMDAPMRGRNAWQVKNTIMSALKATLDRHNNLGGTYTVVTPAYMYTDLIMVSLTDNSRGSNSLPQNAWRFDFEKPLVALADLQGAQNQLMQKITNGTPTDAHQSGPQVGTTTSLPQLQPSPVVGLLPGGFTGNPSVLSTTQTFMNFPAIANSAQFPFAAIS
jgi:hypothetical protein